MDDLNDLPIFKIDYEAFRKPVIKPLPELVVPSPPPTIKPSEQAGIKPEGHPGRLLIPYWALAWIIIGIFFLGIIWGCNI